MNLRVWVQEREKAYLNRILQAAYDWLVRDDFAKNIIYDDDMFCRWFQVILEIVNDLERERDRERGERGREGTMRFFRLGWDATFRMSFTLL